MNFVSMFYENDLENVLASQNDLKVFPSKYQKQSNRQMETFV